MALFEGAIKYRELLGRLQSNQDWVKDYIKELETLEVIRTLQQQINELKHSCPEYKSVCIERLKTRLGVLKQRMQARADSFANKIIAGDSMAGRPFSDSDTELVVDIIKIENYLIPAVERQESRDKVKKRIDGEVAEREKSIEGLQGKVNAKSKVNGRHPYSIDGRLDESVDLWQLYTDNLITLTQENPGEIKPIFSELDKKLLLAKGLKIR